MSSLPSIVILFIGVSIISGPVDSSQRDYHEPRQSARTQMLVNSRFMYSKKGFVSALKKKGMYMHSFHGAEEQGITESSKSICQTLLEEPQPLPTNTIFDDDICH
ncbi:unnamed protein product [Periconia digitata]|uniref:Uncharacterized protein n=1 Tax=Periconia digitata TaxID=1303443 RepID=A0A9W4XW65_9PLEO|nr:unnamed protein product [Periconia digitata]